MTPKGSNSDPPSGSGEIKNLFVWGGETAKFGNRPEEQEKEIEMNVRYRKMLVDYVPIKNGKITIGALLDNELMKTKLPKIMKTSTGIGVQEFIIPKETVRKASEKGQKLLFTARWARGHYKSRKYIPWEKDQINVMICCPPRKKEN